MASLDSLPPDQSAVLQLVLQRGRSYDEIAAMLGIDRAAVRGRALAAFDALGPANSIPAMQRALMTDYLLGQLPPRVADGVRERLASSPTDRAWTRVISAELAELATGPLPEIPVGSAAAGAAAPEPGERSGDSAYGSWAPDHTEPGPAATPAAAGAPPETGVEPAQPGQRRSSRTGGAVLLALLAVAAVVVVVVVVLLVGGSGGGNHHNTVAGTGTTPTTPATGSTPTTSTTPTTTTKAKLLASVALTSPTGSKTPNGAAQVIQDGSLTGIVLVAQGMPANTRANAYAVWLYSSPADKHLLGFVDARVTSNGKLQTEGKLPANWHSFKDVLVTLETQSAPKTPGTVVLHGSF